MKTKTRKPKVPASYHQQLHVDCGGEICIVAANRGRGPGTVRFHCKTCRTNWHMELPFGCFEFKLPADWFGYEPEAK